MKLKKSIKGKAEPEGWTVTEVPVVESSELYQVSKNNQPKKTEYKKRPLREKQTNTSIYDLQTEPKKKRKLQNGVLQQRSEASQNISEFNLNEVGREKVDLNDLIKTSQKLSSAVSLKKQLDNAKQLKSLEVPLSKPQLEKVKRTVAYEKVCNEVTKWEPIVRKNRVADQIVFPLKKPSLQVETFDKACKGFVTKHPVQLAVEALLEKSENKLVPKGLTAAEEKALQAMSLEEAKLRHNELMKHRALISYQELKARRQNKIKSKRYHRILKKEKLKKLMKEFETLQNTDATAAVEKLMEADNLRVMERMTLKHRNTGKWAKVQKIRAKYNPEARSSLKEDINMGKELKSKVPEIESQISKMKSKIETELAEDPDEGLIEKHLQSAMEDLDEIVPPLELEPVKGDLELTTQTKVQKSAPKPKSDLTSDFVNMEFTNLHSYNPSSVSVGDTLDNVEDQSGESGDEGVKNLSEAFADDDIIAEFREDKRAAEEARKPKGMDLFLPGWGSWGGTGIKDSKKKKTKFFIKPIEEPAVKKGTLGNVIVNENADKKLAELQVSSLPFPFSSVRQFESHIRQPVGPTWNPQSSFQAMTAPRVVTAQGKVILPMDAEDAVLDRKETSLPAPPLQEKKSLAAF